MTSATSAPIRLPRGTEFSGLTCPPMRQLAHHEATLVRQGRELWHLTASPDARKWLQTNLASEVFLWETVTVQLP